MITQGSNQALLACWADTLSFAAATLLISPKRCDTLNKERHAADTPEIIFLLLIYLKIAGLPYPSKHEALTQCLADDALTSQRAGQH